MSSSAILRNLQRDCCEELDVVNRAASSGCKCGEIGSWSGNPDLILTYRAQVPVQGQRQHRELRGQLIH